MLPYVPQPCPVPSSTSFSLFDLLSIGGCIETEGEEDRCGAGARGGEERQWRRPATLCAIVAPHALLHLSLSLSLSLSTFFSLSGGGCVEREQLRARRTSAVPELVEENQCGGGSLMPYVPQSLPRVHKISILDKNGINPFSKAPIRHCRWETGNKETVWYFYGPSRTTIANAVGGARWRHIGGGVSFQGQLRRRRMVRSSSSKTAFWNREAHVDGEVDGAEEDNIGE
uniref:NAC domain-containing protein n=1 Tax=Oryza barthii TaxID=65489 RepID=A0A0D3G5T9_9ORYZ